MGAEAGDLASGALKTLKAADKVFVFTPSPALKTLQDEKIAYEMLSAEGGISVIEEKIASFGQGTLCFCFEGSGTDDETARFLIEQKHATLLGGRSKAAYFAALAGLGGDFLSVSARRIHETELSLPLVVYDLGQAELETVKQCLTARFGGNVEVTLIEGGKARNMPLKEIGVCMRAGLVIKEIPLLERERFGFSDVVNILKRLRAPDGCPWDRVQTHESIRENAIEEAYELVDAIDCKDGAKMCEEAGDVLMQALFHALIEEEKGGFTIADMLTGLSRKLITRHTHVFGTDKAKNADGALSLWDENKRKEKGQTRYSDSVNDVPLCFPALLRAQKVCKRVEKGGWDASTLENAEKELFGEFAELKDAVARGDKEEIAGELGDLLFSCAFLARAVGEDAETALADTVKKVQRRYTAYETLVRQDGKDPLTLTKEERDFYYGRCK